MKIFDPDNNLPDCMMPDGGECCAGYSALHEDWQRQRREIQRLLKAVEAYEKIIGSTTPRKAAVDITRDARFSRTTHIVVSG